MRVKDLVNFITAREKARIVKERGPKVFGGGKRSGVDPIIAEYRFCNVRRNDDRVTKWIHHHYLDLWRDQPHLWFALVVARLFNNESTLSAIQRFVLPFKPESMREHLHDRAKAGRKNFNAAYIVSTNGRAMDKVDYVVDIVLKPLWKNRAKITRDLQTGQLANAHMVLQAQQGLGSFMAAQVLADLKYAHPARWDDFATFAASGPGSKRGLNRVMNREIDSTWREDDFRATLTTLRDAANLKLAMEPLTAQDVQNCLCEFDKYERARLGEGRPKQKYQPAELPWEE